MSPRSSLGIDYQLKGSEREFHVLGLRPCLLFSFCPRVNIPHSLPSGKMEIALLKQEKIGRKQPYLGSVISNCWQQWALGDRNVAENPAPTSLVWAWAAEIDMLRGMHPHFIPVIRWVNNPEFPSFTKTGSFSTFSTKTQVRDIVHIMTK